MAYDEPFLFLMLMIFANHFLIVIIIYPNFLLIFLIEKKCIARN